MTLPTQTDYTISDAAALSGVSPNTLRTYEESGLIGTIRRTSRGDRLYSLENIRAARKIYEARIARKGLTGTRRQLPPLPADSEA